MPEMDDGWVEVPAVHEPIVPTRFAKKKTFSGREGQRELESSCSGRYPTRFALFLFNGLPHDWRSCLAPLIDPLTQVAVPLRSSLHRCWLKECMMIPQLASHRKRPSVTLDKSKGSGAVGWKTILRHARVRRGNWWTG